MADDRHRMDLSTLVMSPILENNKDQTIDSIILNIMVSSTAYCYICLLPATIGNVTSARNMMTSIVVVMLMFSLLFT